MSYIHLSIVVPAYNEESNIRLGALDNVYHYLERKPYTWEMIIIDDGSTDETPKLLSEFSQSRAGVSIIRNPHQGKAATVITGLLAAQGDIVLFTDLDQATPINDIEKLLPWFDRGYAVVIGSRNFIRQGAPFWRLIMARGLIIIRSFLLGLHDITDTQCGFKAFRRTVAREIVKQLKLFGHPHRVTGSMVTPGFDIEVLYIAEKRGYKIKDVPVKWHYVETRRVNPLKDSLHGLLDIVRIRINAWKRLYG